MFQHFLYCDPIDFYIYNVTPAADSGVFAFIHDQAAISCAVIDGPLFFLSIQLQAVEV